MASDFGTGGARHTWGTWYGAWSGTWCPGGVAHGIHGTGHMGVYGWGYIWGGEGGRGGCDSPPRSDPSPSPYGEGLARHRGKYHIHITPVTYIYPSNSIFIQRRVWPRTATGLLSGPRAPTVEHQRARRCIGTCSIIPTRGLTTRAWGRDSLGYDKTIHGPRRNDGDGCGWDEDAGWI